MITPQLLSPRRPATLPQGAPPLLAVVVDTEEEFDWSAPFSREATSVEALSELHRFQEVCTEHGVVPTYVCDWPVVTSPEGARALSEHLDLGRCEVGAHLHPWVTPPHTEEVSDHNSYPGNLPPDLEREKLEGLTRAIEEHLGRRPAVYRAGRYGLGPRTAEALVALGYTVDVSPLAGFDLSADGGPDWSSLDAAPYTFGPGGALLGLPATGGYAGWLPGGGGLHRALHGALPRTLRLPGILSRLGAFERLALSPEGFTLAHMQRLTRALFARGLRVFQLSLHSPSMLPGCTSYAQNPQERDELLARCAGYFRWFREEMEGEVVTASSLPQRLEANA